MTQLTHTFYGLSLQLVRSTPTLFSYITSELARLSRTV
jgi:hypothetical protein